MGLPTPRSCLSLRADALNVQQENLRGPTFEENSLTLQQMPKQLELRPQEKPPYNGDSWALEAIGVPQFCHLWVM